MSPTPVLYPTVHVLRDNVKRKTIRHLVAFPDEVSALGKGFVKLLSKTHCISNFIENTEYVKIVLQKNTRKITERFLRGLSLFLYCFNYGDEYSSWARNMANTYFTSDKKRYLDCKKVNLSDYLNKRILIITNSDGEDLQFTI